MTTHIIQESIIVDDVGRCVLRICVALNNMQVVRQSHMIEVEGMINNEPIEF